MIVLILVNYAKSNTAFTPAERVELARRVTKDLPNVRVDFFGGPAGGLRLPCGRLYPDQGSACGERF